MASIFDDVIFGPGQTSVRNQPNKQENDLFIACSRNNLKKVEEMLSQATHTQQNIDVTYVVNGFSCLHTAAKKGYVDIVSRLVSYNDQCAQTRTSDGRDALMIAAYEGHLPVLVALIGTERTLVDNRDRNGNTALHYAAWGGHLSCVQCLVQQAGAQVTLKNNDQMLPLQYAAAGNHADIIEFLLQSSGEELHDDSVLGLNALHRAAQYGSLQIVQLLLSSSNHAYAIAQSSANGSTALHYAAQHGHAEVVDWLLTRADADIINQQNEFGLCSLHYACIGGYSSVVESLLKAGARTDLCNSQGENALQLSAASGKHELCRVLVADYAADVFAKDHEGGEAKPFGVFSLLVYMYHLNEGGANTGKSAIDKAVESGYKELANMLALEACIQHLAKELQRFEQK